MMRQAAVGKNHFHMTPREQQFLAGGV